MLLVPILTSAQETLKLKNHRGGLFSLGTRTTISTFNQGSWQGTSVGAGGQFRLQIHDRINMEFFADYLTSNIGNTGKRQDAHVGWSVMYYPLKDKTFTKFLKPYLVMGHCFQVGAGNHFNITERFDLTFVAQYMFHLGGHVEAHESEGILAIHDHGGLSLEGHLLFTLGVNYKIADLW